MLKFLSFTALMGIVLTSCQHPYKKKTPEKIDYVIVAYQENGTVWRFNTAVRRQAMGRKFLSDSGLDAKEDYLTTFRLGLQPIKADSITDSTHKLLRINRRYTPQYLPDSLSHYIHILDSSPTAY